MIKKIIIGMFIAQTMIMVAMLLLIMFWSILHHVHEYHGVCLFCH